MPKNRTECLCFVLTSMLLAGSAHAATPNSPETWDSGAVGGWTRQDPLNAGTHPLTNPTNYLQLVFSKQSKSFPQVHIIRADADASNGDFSGNYWWTAITNVSFKLYCESHVPVDLRLYLCNTASGRWWYYPLSEPIVGEWIKYSVPLEYSSGWRLGIDGTSKQFKEDRENIEWLGIQIQRNSSTDRQVYGIDNLVLYGASSLEDADNDGASDRHEFIAGTDSGNPNSRFEVGIGVTNRPDKVRGIVLRWTSAPDRLYSIQRATDLMEGFTQIDSGIPGMPPTNMYEDVTATNAGPYFYRIEVQ